MKGLRVLLTAVAALAVLTLLAGALAFPFDFSSGGPNNFTLSGGYPVFQVSGFNSAGSPVLTPGPNASPFSSPVNVSGENINAISVSPGPPLPPDNIGGAKIATGNTDWTYYQSLPLNTPSQCFLSPATAIP